MKPPRSSQRSNAWTLYGMKRLLSTSLAQLFFFFGLGFRFVSFCIFFLCASVWGCFFFFFFFVGGGGEAEWASVLKMARFAWVLHDGNVQCAIEIIEEDNSIVTK